MAEGSNTEYPRLHIYDLETLDNHIAQHKKADDSRSILSSAVSQLWSSNNSLQDLERLSAEAHRAKQSGDTATLERLQRQFADRIDADAKAQESTNEFTHYASGFCKTMPLFIGGKQLLGKAGGFGLATTVLAYGLDRASLNDNQDLFAKKLILGGLEGGLTKAAFFGLEKVKFENEALQALAHSPAMKGMALGIAGRGINASVEAALDPTTKSFADGAAKVFNQTVDGKSLFTDAALFTVAHGTMRGANWFTGGAFDARPLYQTVGMSTSFGLSNGAHHEYTRQVQAGGPIDYTKVLERALLQGGIDAVAGIPGGIIADPKFRARPLATLMEDATTARNQLGGLKDRLVNGAAVARENISEVVAQSLGPRPQFAFAMASDGSIGRTPGAVPERVTMAGIGYGGSADRMPGRLDKITLPVPERLAAVGADPVIGVVEKPVEVVALRPITVEERTAVSKHVEPFKQGTGTNTDVVGLYEYLATHPEVDAHMAEVYRDNFDNASVRRVIEGFYKPPVAIYNEPLLHNDLARQQLLLVYQHCQNDNVRLSASMMARGISEFIAQGKTKGVDITPAVEHYARVSHDKMLVQAIDIALGTDYSSLLNKFLPSVRNLPVDATEMEARTQTAQAVHRMAAGLDGMPGVTTSTDGKVEFVAASGAKLTAEDVARAGKLRDDAITSARAKLGAEEPGAARVAVTELSRHLDHPTAPDWYVQWRQQAALNLPHGAILETAPVLALGDAAVIDFLGSKWPDCPAAGRNVQEQFRNKLYLLNDISTRFMKVAEGSGEVTGQELATRLLEAAKIDPQSVREIADGAKSGGDAYRDWVAKGLEAGRPIATLKGETAVATARLESALPDAPDVIAKLQAFASADANFKLSDLVHKMTHPKLGAEFTKLVAERARTAGVTAADLNADALFTELNVRKTFNRTPEAADKLVALGRSNPVGLQELVKDPFASQQPRGRGKPAPPTPEDQSNKQLGFAYKDTIAALAPQAKTLAALQEVMNALKAGRFEHAFGLVLEQGMQPPGAEWHRTQLLMAAVAEKNGSLIPPKPRNDAGTTRSQPAPEVLPRVEGPARTTEPPVIVDPLEPTGGGKVPPVDGKVPDGRSDGGRTPGGSVLLDDIMPAVALVPTKPSPIAKLAGLSRLTGDAVVTAEAPGVGKSTIEAVLGESTATAEKPVVAQPKPAGPPIEDSIRVWVEQMQNGLPAEKRAAARELAKHLMHESSVDWFDAWRANAPELLPAGFQLKTPGVTELPPEVLFDALTAPQGERGAPEKTKQPRFEERLGILADAARALGGDQAVLNAVIKHGASDLASVREIIFRADHPQYGDLYKQELKAQLEAGQTDLKVFGRKTIIDEMRVRRAFAPRAEDTVREDVGPRLAEAGARGEIDLRSVLDQLNSEQGEQYRKTVQEKLAAGQTDMSQFGRRTFMDEIRIVEALKYDPALNGDQPGTIDLGAEMAAAAARGEIDARTLGNVLRNLNNPYCGRLYRQVLYGTAQMEGNTAAALAGEEFLFSAARTYRAFESNPDVAQKLIDLTNEQRPLLKELMSDAPRDRALQQGYNAILAAIVPQATTADQVRTVMKAVIQNNADKAFDVAADIRPVDDAAWLKTRQLIVAVAAGDARTVQSLLPKPERRNDGGNRGAGNGGANGGGNGTQDGGSRPEMPQQYEPEPDPRAAKQEARGGKRRNRDRDRDRRDRDDESRWQ